MSHCARYLSLGPWVPDSFLPVDRLKTVTCSSPDSLLIHSIHPPADEAVEAGRLLLTAVAAEPGVMGRSGVTPI